MQLAEGQVLAPRNFELELALFPPLIVRSWWMLVKDEVKLDFKIIIKSKLNLMTNVNDELRAKFIVMTMVKIISMVMIEVML